MTTPTDAQITAAKAKVGVRSIAKIIFENLPDIDGDEADWLFYKENLETAAEQIIALTAAVEVGPKYKSFAEVAREILEEFEDELTAQQRQYIVDQISRRALKDKP